jgi:replicative DNA helicase
MSEFDTYSIESDTRGPDHWPDPIPLSADYGPEIPGDILPGCFGEFASALSAAMETPPALATLVTLGCLSTACNGKFFVRINASWVEPVNIYTVISMPPGSRKSPVFSRCRGPIEQWDQNQRKLREHEIKRQKSERINQEKLIEKYRNKAVNENDEGKRRLLFERANELSVALSAPESLPSTFTTDATPEALAAKVSEQGGRYAVLSDEAGVVEVMSGLYSDGKANIDIYLKGWDGSIVRIERKSESIDSNPYLVMVITIQPKVLADLGKKSAIQGNGMMERILWVVPRSNLGERHHNSESIPEGISLAYEARMRDILDCKQQGQELALTDDAADELKAFRMAIEKLMKPSGKLREISGWAAKLPGQAVRIAGLLHVADHGPSCPSMIEGATMLRALHLAALLQAHAQVAFLQMSADSQEYATRRLLDYLPRFGTQPRAVSEIRRIVKNVCVLKGKALTDALATLAEHNFLREVSSAKGSRGRMSRWFEVNPRIL